ncbi:alkaline phosphatase D family protein [Marinobacter nauticus]|uniref:alkaline phosphatase D family protein n=1 Tax=Marinobacter nauticus TaxID=2743 RepID=UPI001C559FDB|nr:alkaline phosphatase D family protein [Marinobacter nauticus]MBW3198246.1 alkaline phosphatase D family protein [Marinobacter nauticus]MBY6183656.1 alkaline phosphatase D family protein [Marinobacter nauticus]
MARLTRRDFLKASALGMGAVAISTGLAGCVLDSDDKRRVDFTHGVASGDPLQDSVILWTRAVPERGSKVKVGWEIATDAEFVSVVRSGTAETTEAHDFTIKVDAQGLMPGQRYYYRFRSSGATSPVGAATTLPEGSVEQVRLAVVSCSNYPAGYFHVYREVANQADLDAVVHLGDYIYEYSSDPDSYASEEAQALGRTFPENNNRELLTLVDYRRRYAIYREDPDLQLAHQRLPFIVVWDDHEVANDTWRNGAENHDDSEGDFEQRKLAALQAFFEWMPIRPVIEGNDEAIYRSFRFGDLVDLHMLDTRVIGRDQQLDYLNYLSEAGLNVDQFTADVTDPNRTLLGAEQRLWLQNKLATSTGRWQVLGQQVLMGRMDLPAELLLAIATETFDDLPVTLQELATLKGMQLQGMPLTEEQEARISTAAPYNLDAWDGYQAEREVVLGMARQLDKNLVVLAGDTHNAWANNLKDMYGNQVGVEFATASVSSPGLEDYLGLTDATIAGAEKGIGLLVDGLDYLNINQRGYMVVTFTQEEARANWYFVDTVKSQEYTVDSSRSAARRTLPGAGNRAVVPVQPT